MNPAELYVNGIKKKLALYHAAWLPNAKFHLGDVGELNDNFFQSVRNLKDMNIAFQELPDNSPSNLDIVSDQGVSITFKATGQTNPSLPNVPNAEAGIAIEFGSVGAFLIQASDVFESSIADIAKLQADVLDAYMRGAWKLQWAVIVRLVHTSNAMILVSRSSGAKLEMSASGDIPISGLKLADANVKLTVLHQSGDLVRVDRAVNVTPLFQLARIHRRVFAGPVVRLEKAASSLSHMAELTPELARSDPRVADSLYLDLVH
jgi:hypothetical protein